MYVCVWGGINIRSLHDRKLWNMKMIEVPIIIGTVLKSLTHLEELEMRRKNGSHPDNSIVNSDRTVTRVLGFSENTFCQLISSEIHPVQQG